MKTMTQDDAMKEVDSGIEQLISDEGKPTTDTGWKDKEGGGKERILTWLRGGVTSVAVGTAKENEADLTYDGMKGTSAKGHWTFQSKSTRTAGKKAVEKTSQKSLRNWRNWIPSRKAVLIVVCTLIFAIALGFSYRQGWISNGISAVSSVLNRSYRWLAIRPVDQPFASSEPTNPGTNAPAALPQAGTPPSSPANSVVALSLALNEDQMKDVHKRLENAADILNAAQNAVVAKKAEIAGKNAELQQWATQLVTATDAATKKIAEENVEAAKGALQLFHQQLTLLEAQEKGAQEAVDDLRSLNRALLSNHPLDAVTLKRVMKSSIEEGVGNAMALAAKEGNAKLGEIAKAVTDGNGKIADELKDVATEVKGVATKVASLEKPLQDIAKYQEEEAKEAKLHNERIDVVLKNFQGYDGRSLMAMEKVIEFMEEFRKLQKLHAGDAAELKRLADIAERLEEKLEKKLSAVPAAAAVAPPRTAPVIRTAPPGTYYGQPNCTQYGNCAPNQFQGAMPNMPRGGWVTTRQD